MTVGTAKWLVLRQWRDGFESLKLGGFEVLN